MTTAPDEGLSWSRRIDAAGTLLFCLRRAEAIGFVTARAQAAGPSAKRDRARRQPHRRRWAATPLPFSARWIVCLLSLLIGCAPRVGAPEGPPDLVVGAFADDYGSTYEITARTWVHRGYARYHVVRWRAGPEGGYLVAWNDESNPADAGLWTRIDWVRLDEMAPYDWAFCLSAYNAPTAAAAESTQVARPATPRTGCNGHPFTRMQRSGPADP